jgi:hypothetical protein
LKPQAEGKQRRGRPPARVRYRPGRRGGPKHLGPIHGEIVLDFFAGTGTTGQAVLARNAAGADVRRFLPVEPPERLAPPVILADDTALATTDTGVRTRPRRADRRNSPGPEL